ncbi:MAG TPA: hypothetical protein RMG45_06825, partial [Polyangiaceae bacterium LLY-WYZ-15_(1-7)]|nr:hypothetical protein [Polyangiaceae bacterium LLY-WYZ-15_(1-7)]HJL45528.1 hypothetical protein [Polyangiaceae bacterium LLY-WYZ-15_(1-7)]
MRTRIALSALAMLTSLAARPASAQRVISYDTLGGETPSAVTCGFCAGERFGTVFRELPPPARGLNPEDFPLELRSVRVAVASATVERSGLGFACSGSVEGGSALVDMTIWAGVTPPSGDISAEPELEAWSEDEVLVWAGESIPLMRSAAESEGSAMYEVGFNELRVVDEDEAPIRVEAPATYLRVVIELSADASDRSEACEAGESPGAFPMRDDDGRIAGERGFIWASGAGWLWNEDARVNVNGDWALRIEVVPMGSPTADAGPSDVDAGAVGDAGAARDAGAMPEDAGPADVDAGPSDAGGDEG